MQENDVKSIRSFCEEMMFDPAILPQLSPEERNRYNQFQDDLFFDYVDKITSSGRETFYEDYDFNIKPASDNRAYFSQYIKWRNLKRLAQFFGNRSLPFFEIGYLLVIITLVQISIASFVLILLPLFKIGWKGKSKAGIILYFGGIGLGYMFVEMVFIQRFMLYFGNPVYAGIGCDHILVNFLRIRKLPFQLFYAIQKKTADDIHLHRFYTFCILVFINTHFTANSSCKHVLKIVDRFPDHSAPRILHGYPFPGRAISNFKDELRVVPWAWGINGIASVISTALATIVAVEMGFTWVMLFAALAYCLPLFVQVKMEVKKFELS